MLEIIFGKIFGNFLMKFGLGNIKITLLLKLRVLVHQGLDANHMPDPGFDIFTELYRGIAHLRLTKSMTVPYLIRLQNV
jgi:hypothetical protein